MFQFYHLLQQGGCTQRKRKCFEFSNEAAIMVHKNSGPSCVGSTGQILRIEETPMMSPGGNFQNHSFTTSGVNGEQEVINSNWAD